VEKLRAEIADFQAREQEARRALGDYLQGIELN
jgi:hypothetical protein